MKGRKGGESPFGKDQVVAELGHELGNVLNGLLGMTRLVRESKLSAEQELWLKAIEQSGRQLRRLVDAFGQGCAAPGESLPSRPVSLDGIDLLEQALLAHAPAACSRANRLLLIVDPGLTRHWICDPCLLRQLLDNLLGNAIKFTHSGDVVIEVAMERCGTGSAGTLILTVVDSGPGVDASLGRRIFEAFERGPEHVRDGSGGYGLGLFICRRIARALGGGIAWSTPAAGGARFEVRLPGVIAESPAGPAPLPARVLGDIECHLALSGLVLRSVASCLARMGVAWRRVERQDTVSPADRPVSGLGGEPESDLLVVSVDELAVGSGQPRPQLLLQTSISERRGSSSRALRPPILECTLGPLLLALALEWSWFRNEAPD